MPFFDRIDNVFRIRHARVILWNPVDPIEEQHLCPVAVLFVLISLCTMKRSFRIVLCFIIVSAIQTSCNDSPATATVTGTVRFNGQPLVNAFVTFEPIDRSRPSFGTTDSAGKYTLRFSPTKMGAIPGEHKVTIETETGEPGSANYLKEILPARYNSKSELSTVLKRGKQTINFDLEP